MNKFCRNIFPAFLLLAVIAVAALGQNKPLPFAPGEKLTYEAKLSKIIGVGPVADLTFTVASGQDAGDLNIKADASSKGTLLKIARFSFLYQFSSDIDGKNFRIERTQRKTAEKERLRNGEANFDYSQKRVTYVETDPAEPMKPPRKIASNIEDETHDVVSGIYALRLLPLAVGKAFHLTVSDSGMVYDVPVRVTARELQKTVLGKVWCFHVEPDVFGPGKMIEDKGSMAIWITDDARRIPVRSRINTSYGRFDVRLRSIDGAKSPEAVK
jgi:hypothetical protein